MSRKQLTGLFICNLIPFVVGNSLMALLPIYIGQELGAGSMAAGVVIATAFASLAVSTTMSSQVARRFKHHATIIRVSALICVPLTFMLGWTNQIVLFTVLMGGLWFFSGIQVAMTQILTALYADQNRRGHAFGILMATGGLSQLIGGFVSGRIVAHWGYPVLFASCALLYVVPIIVSMIIDDSREAEPISPTEKVKSAYTGQPLLVLMGASIIAHVAIFAISMARPLAMNALNFSPTAITSTIAISGLITLPLPILSGWLSDRFGRRSVLTSTYILTTAGAVFHILAGSLWQFWIAQALISVLTCSVVVGSALVTDLVPRGSIESSVTRFTTTPWIGAVIGSTSAGFTVQQLGTTMTFEIATVLLFIAILMMPAIHTGGLLKTKRAAAHI